MGSGSDREIAGAADQAGGEAVYAPPVPDDRRANPIATLADWRAQRAACERDPGDFHGRIAARVLHWYHPGRKAWLSRGEDGRWTGWSVEDGAAVELAEDWQPWTTAFDDSDAPFYRWFSGGLTNAAFNEVDRHVAAGHGGEIAYHFEGDRWDPAANDGRGGPVHHEALTRRDLLVRSVVAARALQRLGLKRGDRVALNMPNILDQIVWTEAAKRLGVIYTAVFGGFSDKTLSDRIENAGAEVVITADAAWRNAEVAPFKEAYTDPALDNYISLDEARAIVEAAARERCAPALTDALLAAVDAELSGEITVARADVMRAAGHAFDAARDLDPAQAAELRADLAEALAGARRRVRAVIVVRHVGIADIAWNPERDRWAHDLLAEAERDVLTAAGVADRAALDKLDDRALAVAMWRAAPVVPVDAEFPLFIIYTSGSTGKPKGVVHVHGGYVAGVTHTMAVSFDAVGGRDVMYVVADPGWITGQSYLITASLAARVTGIVTEGAPVFPHAGRFASIIERYGVTIFKAGVTFLKSVMSNPANRADVARYDTSGLRVATFCAEPTSPAVQRFGMETVTPQYINSYWATEHGGIVWTHPYGNADLRLRADAHTYPLPWVMGDVWVGEGEPDADGRCPRRRAEVDEKGEVVITAPYPYLARTIWGDGEHVGEPGWRGDLERFRRIYFDRFTDEDGRPVLAYVQGDFARRHEDGSFSLHGRSDDVINVSGHRMGTEEIEGAILKDKQINPHSPVGNVVVVGAPHRDKGLTPVAFIQPAPGARLGGDDERRLKDLVRVEKGAVAVPSDIITVDAFPETRSGKYMRRFLKAMMLGEPLGDVTTLRNPECLEPIKAKIDAWKEGRRRLEAQTLFEDYRFVRVQYDRVGGTAAAPIHTATVTIANPPVNALSDRVLDEIGTVIGHLDGRDDVGAVVITGAGTRSFVAGADVRQLLEDMPTREEVRALPAKAHAAFRAIERMGKPVIAAIDGFALGGGAELAYACHARVGNARTHMGQPEINLFLPPGYGGTQRLARLLGQPYGREVDPDGMATALWILLSGRRIDGERARELGLLDYLCTGTEDVTTVARAEARRAALSREGWAFDAWRRRGDLLGMWADPVQLPDTVFDGDVQAVISQAEWAGRGKVAQAIIALVRTGMAQGFEAGLAAEIEAFADFAVDEEHGGRLGIRLFLDKNAPPLPARPRPDFTPEERAALVARGELLPVGSPFFPGATPLPKWQYAQAVVRDIDTGAAEHGDPAEVERELVIPVPKPGPNEALLYVLASEINYNDVWAITGIPVSLFDEHDEDVHVTGSGGVAMVAALGEALQGEARLKVGDLVAVYSGVSDLLDPLAGTDPMATDFHIQGYQSPDGSHQQFMLAQGPQCLPLAPGLTLEAAGSYILAAGTAYRALATTLGVRPGRSLLVEGAASGTGAWGVQLGLARRLNVTGFVSSDARAAAVEATGARAVNRRDFADCFTPVPADPAAWAAWEAEGAPLMEALKAAGGGALYDYAMSHAGERAFARTFQALAPGGKLTFFGASSGYHMTFIGKPGRGEARDMLHRAGLQAGEAVLVFYGGDGGEGGEDERDRDALAAIEAAREAGAHIVVVTETDAERDFVLSLGYGDAVLGALSLAEIKRRAPEFDCPKTMPDLPDPQRETQAFKETVRRFTDDSFKPLANAVGRLLRSSDNPRGMPDLVVERARADTLFLSTMMVRPFGGRVVYLGEMGGRRYSFYAPQVWMRQRRIIMPSAEILGTHLSNAAEVAGLNRVIAAGRVEVAEPYLADWHDLAACHQAMWENRLTELSGGRPKAVANHALPMAGLTTRDELLTAWVADSDGHDL